MATEYPYVYPYSRAEARRLKETRMYEDSFRLNVNCARDIEKAIQECFDEANGVLSEGCAQPVLEAYGFKRVWFVLSNSLREIAQPRLVSEDLRQWAQRPFVPPDGKYNRNFAVDTAASLLESFIGQTRAAYQALGLFGAEHCLRSEQEPDYTGKVLVLSPGALRESHWSPRDQLWLATGGAGCMADKLGSTVFAVCLSDGESTRWTRSNFIGVLDEQFLPDWAAEKLAELRGSQEIQPEKPSGGMEMK